jgi:acetoin utilization deacetylase AcuC-like enzyme
VERPARVEAIQESLAKLDLFETVAPKHFGDEQIRAVHDGRFVTYLHDVCAKISTKRPVYPYVFPIRRPDRRPKDLALRAGYYCIDTFTPLDGNAYSAARSAVDVALTAAGEVMAGRRAAYAVCRPPGHHAERGVFGGFCYFNNAAIAAHRLSRHGKVAMLDVDFHHGNGAQDIFYSRPDVLTVSIHGHPNYAYPYFSGFADELGEAEGKGFNRNYPLPEDADEKLYFEAMDAAIAHIRRFKPVFLVVCLGLDTMRGDPTGSFGLTATAMKRMGARISAVAIPTLVVQEGGYSLRNLKRGVAAFFEGLAEDPLVGHPPAGKKK